MGKSKKSEKKRSRDRRSRSRSTERKRRSKRSPTRSRSPRRRHKDKSSLFSATCKEMSASGTSPSAAEEALSTTGEKANFQRLTRLLMRGGLPLLREVFDSIHPRGSLPDVLRDNKVRLENLRTPTGNKVFSFAEWKCLYKPRGPTTYGESAEFDITILYKLLRSICSLTAPETGWNELPNSTDDSREADIVRIRYYRNTIYSHNRLMEVTDANFDKLWMEIRDTLLRIAGGISSAKKDEWKKAIEKLFHDQLTPDVEECFDELQFWYLRDMETKHTLDQMQFKQAEMQFQQAEMQFQQAEMQKQIKQLHSKLDIFIAAFQQEPSNSALEVEGAQSPSESVETRISIPQEQPSAEGTTGQFTSRELPASQQNDTEVQNLWDYVRSSKRSLNRLKNYLKKKFGANVQGDRRGSLIITVSCSSLEVLEELWEEYRTGHLNEVIQATLVTAEVLEKLNLKEVKLRTIISEEDYLSYKKFLNKSAAKGKMTIPQVQGSPAMELVEGKTQTKSSQEPAVIASKLPADETETKSSQEPAVFGSKLPAGPTHVQLSQMVEGGYIVESGYVLIINNYPVDELLERKDTEKKIFAQIFRYTTREDINLTTGDMLKALTDTAQRDFSNNDCFCCIIRSTGTENGICGTDDKPIDITTITSLFSKDKCPSLNGKPKIFVLGFPNFRTQEFKVLGPGDITKAKLMLRNLVISEEDFLVWNLFDEPQEVAEDWPKLLFEEPLRKVIRCISSPITREKRPISLVSTLKKDVFFGPKIMGAY